MQGLRDEELIALFIVKRALGGGESTECILSAIVLFNVARKRGGGWRVALPIEVSLAASVNGNLSGQL